MKRKLSLLTALTLAILLLISAFPASGVLADEILILSVESPYSLVGGEKTQIDEADRSVRPIVENGRTLVPLRFVAEQLGCAVDWKENGTITIKGPERITLCVGSDQMKVGQNQISLEAPAQLLGSRTYVPLRAICEALGKEVFYDKGLIAISDEKDLFDPEADRETLDQLLVQIHALPVVGTAEELQSLIRQSSAYVNVPGGGGRFISGSGAAKDMNIAFSDGAPVPVPMPSALPEASADADYSSTNVQVEGVDEADIVKTDGSYIYRISENQLFIVSAVPAENMALVSQYDFEDFYPFELFVDGDRLAVLGNSYRQTELPQPSPLPEDPFAVPEDTPEPKLLQDSSPLPQPEGTAEPVPAPTVMPDKGYYYPQYRTESYVKAMVFDVSDKAAPVLSRTLELEGNYLTSRKMGSVLYLIANQYALPYGGVPITPCYYDTAKGAEKIMVDCGAIRYFPDMEKNTYIQIGAVDLSALTDDFHLTTYLANGENVYMSRDNLYISSTKYHYRPWILKADGTYQEPEGEQEPTTTVIYKFGIDQTTVSYLDKGEIPGTIINQFSMDEHNGYLRIGTTDYDADPWQNNLYILDPSMNISGKINNIAPGERIYSTRFMGDRGYMVTFKTTDPLFAMDLSDPANPQIMGELKIPGYSEYLHPFDETHLIGFGKEAEADERDNAYYQGLKMALFDVSDIHNPVELFVETIGERGTSSPVLNNHKALLFNKEKNLLVLPVEVYQKTGETPDGITAYGTFDHQAAYLYYIDLSHGFQLRDQITHMTKKANQQNWYQEYDRFIDRSLYIGDTLYTSSPAAIKATSLTTLDELGMVEFPAKK